MEPPAGDVLLAMDDLADHDLLGRDDPAAFAELRRRHAPMVAATCRRVLADPSLADDAAQETFLQLLRDRQRVHGAVGAWLHRVATTKALDLGRREGRLRRRQEIAAAAAAGAPDAALIAAVDEAVDALPDDQRLILVATHLEGASQARIAAELGCSQATVSRRLADAEESLRRRLRDAGIVVALAALLDALRPAAAAEPLPAPRVTPPLAPIAVAAGVVALVAVVAVVAAAVTWPRNAPSLPVQPPPPAASAATPPSEDPAMIDQQLVRRAVAAIYAGDQESLAALLRAHPGLAHARVAGDDQPYDGYFHGATLLHHVAGNPNPATGLVPRAVASARLLLAAGAEVDARTTRGPAQPDAPDSTTLALLVSSAPECIGNQRDELVDVLVAAGADVDADGGEPLAAALYYRAAAAGGVESLMRHHPRLDVRFAAGVGDVATLRAFFADDGALKPGASFLSRYPHGPAGSDRRDSALIVADALAFACSGAPTAARTAAVEFLLAHGADAARVVDGRTALHEAAFGGDEALVRLLLAHGGDPSIRDDRFHSDAAGWAAHAHHDDVAALLRAWPAR